VLFVFIKWQCRTTLQQAIGREQHAFRHCNVTRTLRLQKRLHNSLEKDKNTNAAILTELGRCDWRIATQFVRKGQQYDLRHFNKTRTLRLAYCQHNLDSDWSIARTVRWKRKPIPTPQFLQIYHLILV